MSKCRFFREWISNTVVRVGRVAQQEPVELSLMIGRRNRLVHRPQSRHEVMRILLVAMEANPAAALIQTPPAIVNARTLFGRLQQFAGRVYGPGIAAGIA